MKAENVTSGHIELIRHERRNRIVVGWQDGDIATTWRGHGYRSAPVAGDVRRNHSDVAGGGPAGKPTREVAVWNQTGKCRAGDEETECYCQSVKNLSHVNLHNKKKCFKELLCHVICWGFDSL